MMLGGVAVRSLVAALHDRVMVHTRLHAVEEQELGTFYLVSPISRMRREAGELFQRGVLGTQTSASDGQVQKSNWLA